MPLSWIDTHCHLDAPAFAADRLAVRAAARAAGVAHCVLVAVERSNWQAVRDLAHATGDSYALGIHPLFTPQAQESDIAALRAQLEQWQGDPQLVAVGEIGLDLYRDEPQFDRQQALLEAQLRLAKRYDLPVILHSRRTHDKLAMLLKKHALPRTGVVHGFAGSLQQAERFVQLGYKIGVGGTITYPRASKTREVMARLPLSALLLETDAPDMPLNGFQGQPNRPERAACVFSTLCELRPEPAEEIASTLMSNTKAIFALQ